MGAYLIDNPPARSQYRNPRRSAPSGVIAMHTAENTPDFVAFDGGAEAVARFIRDRDTPGSYHDLVDSDSSINLVPYDFEAFHDGTGTNPHSLGLSVATRADVWPLAPQAWKDGAVRNAAARALFNLQPDRAATFTRALREGTPERRRKIGQALAGSGLAGEAVGYLTGESREKTYDAFSLLFLMAKAGEVAPLMQAIEDYPNVEVRIAVVKLLALSGQPEIIPSFRRLAVRGSLPSEVRSAVMEAIYQISSQARASAPSAA